MNSFGKYLKELLSSRNISPQGIAAIIKVDSSLIRKWIANNKVPSLKSEYYDLLCKHLQLSEAERIRLKKAQIQSLEENSTRLSDLLKAEQRADENEQAMISLLHAINEAAILIDSTGKIIATNMVVAERLAISTEELVGRCIYDFFPPELAEHRINIINKVFQTGQPAMYKEHSGSRVLQHSLYPAKDSTGQVIKVAIVAVDLTEIENTLNELHVSEERHRLLFQYSMDAVLLTRPDGTILAANPAACDFFQMTETEICASGRNGIMDTQDKNLAPALEVRRLTGKVRAQLSVIKGNGTKVSVDITSAVFRNSRDEVESYVIIRPI